MSDVWIHGANVLYLASYLVRDILLLRVLTVVAGLTLLPFYVLRPDPIWVAVAWNALFIAINLVQIHRLLLERRPVRLTQAELTLYQQAFSAMSQRDFVKLLRTGRWKTASASECIVAQGVPVTDLIVVCSGSVAVKVEDREVTTLDAGRFVGEMSYLTGEPTSASVWTREPTQYVAWARDALQKIFVASSDVRSGVQLAIGADLARKLKRT
jgi:CRP-like cAMP-binding protein